MNHMADHALYWAGFQKGSTDIAKRVPIMETGIVDPSIPIRTEGNCRQKLFQEHNTVPSDKQDVYILPCVDDGVLIYSPLNNHII